jgi:isorenieratene synthase
MSRSADPIPPRAPGRSGGQAEPPLHVCVIGGGLAGVAAATVLSERGARVTLFEREASLGGRVSGWPDRLDGTPFDMERGFHAFFRHYYNLRRLLRRIDPPLRKLMPLEDYPILGPDGFRESFAGVPRRPPFNLMAVVWRTPTMRLRDTLRINHRAARAMLAFDAERTYTAYDEITAKDYLDSLRFPPRARQMLFDVFAHSFFNPEEEFSAGELLMMFHYYFLGNPEGLVFDVLTEPFRAAIWQPFEELLQSNGVTLRLRLPVDALEGGPDGRWRVRANGEAVIADAVVLALDVPGLKTLVGASPRLGDGAWRQSIEALEVTRPFAVWRLWLDRPLDAGRAPFAGTTGFGLLDNISLYHLFERDSRSWAERHGGAVAELHGYAIDPGLDEQAIRADLLAQLHAVYPETRGATILDERFLLRRDCPAFPPGCFAGRPGVRTPFPGVVLSGDFVKIPFPSALMERACTSGILAANEILSERGVGCEPVRTIPERGLLA